MARVPTEDIISSAYASMRRELSRGSRRSASPGGLHPETQGSKSPMSTDRNDRPDADGARTRDCLNRVFPITNDHADLRLADCLTGGNPFVNAPRSLSL